jgi:hypothetical protein
MVCVSTRTHATCTGNQSQPSAISHQPISHQSSTISHQPSVTNHFRKTTFLKGKIQNVEELNFEFS